VTGTRYTVTGVREIFFASESLVEQLIFLRGARNLSVCGPIQSVGVVKPSRKGGGDGDKGVHLGIGSIPAQWLAPMREAYMKWKSCHFEKLGRVPEGGSYPAQAKAVAWASHAGLNYQEAEDLFISLIRRLDCNRSATEQLNGYRNRWLELVGRPHYGVLNSDVPAALHNVLAQLRKSSTRPTTRLAKAFLLTQICAEEGQEYKKSRRYGSKARGICCPEQQLACMLVLAGIYKPAQLQYAALKLVERFLKVLKSGGVAGVRLLQLDEYRGRANVYRLDFDDSLQPDSREHLGEFYALEFSELAAQSILPNEMLGQMANSMVKNTWPNIQFVNQS